MAALNPLKERLVGVFRPLQGQSLPGYMMRELEVEWSLPPDFQIAAVRRRLFTSIIGSDNPTERRMILDLLRD
jgi:hypothetical protein